MKKTYRQILEENETKSKWIIASFLILYAFIGFLADILMHAGKNIAFQQSFYELLTFKQFPILTLIMLLIAAIAVYVTFHFHDRLMLFGAQYQEIIEGNFDNQTDQQIYNIVEELKIAANLKYMPKVFIIHEDYMNAFASGYSEKSAMVAITTGLITKLNRAEIQAVLAHEISHIKHMDIKITLFIGVLSNLMLMAVDLLFNIFRFRGKDSQGNAASVAMLIVFFLRLFLPLITTVMTLYMSRTREYMADAGAVKLTRDNEAMASALLKIHHNYEDNDYQDEGIYVRQAAYIYNPLKKLDIFSTHPSLDNRLEALGFKKDSY